MAWMSGGSLAAQGGASSFIGSWKSSGASVFTFTENEMSMSLGKVLIWTASYTVQGRNLVLDAKSLNPGLSFMQARCATEKGPPNCLFVEKYQIIVADNSTIHLGGMNAPQILLTRQGQGALNGLKPEALVGNALKNVDMVRNKRYFSANSLYYFVWQDDGNLVLNKDNGEYVWSLDKSYKGPLRDIKTLRLQPDGNFVALNAAGGFLWSPLNANNQNPPNSPTELIATIDGKLWLIHRPSRKTLWSVP
jgi:hypothetical protein